MSDLSAARALEATPHPVPTVQYLAIRDIRRDGGTQCRIRLNQETIRRYHAQMVSGVEFPPVRVWFDNEHYWLSDGFQRLAAAEQIPATHILAEVHFGSREDAQWESYSSNSAHGLPRGTADLRNAIGRALVHPYSARLSSIQIARHLGIPESTFRRWRNHLSLRPGEHLSSSPGEDSVRIAQRNGKFYPMRIEAIGRTGARASSGKGKSTKELESALSHMKEKASPEVKRVLTVIANWAFGTVSNDDCLKALEVIHQRCKSAGY